ncbi:MAG: hypothetical protein A3C55_04100 [Gammaproteobacteria bacterium RIFCSPHIGHO2_02_FULL_42_13]|nr:MAG: hypothetical protein A3C55_04100 [Gammaproteobacteria bacterium RIFCSPHIGHO2_02_FULL_42_13]OGT70629.1 MAG: hypothetical protein A3H43_00280 [Gammaproteobacteria bacterium RIFCSPLOWO2_02_FULL_42_9]
MRSIQDILTHQPYHKYEDWRTILMPQTAEQKFVFMLLPVAEYIYQRIKKTTSLSSTFLKKMIAEDLISKFTPVLARVCAMEMHSVSDRKILIGKTSQERFNYYIALLQIPKNALDLFAKYTELASYISIAIHQYITVTREFLNRLEKDKGILYKNFLNNDQRFLLHHIKSTGDTHCQGRAVLVLTFKNHRQEKNIVYKPRSLKIDIACQQFLSWLNQYQKIQHAIPTIIDKKYYGWCEYVTAKPCQNVKALKRFYKRAGSLLAILHILSGSDIHRENLIAHGEYPVIVDFECLLQPNLSINQQQKIQRTLVSQTFFLPKRMMVKADHNGIDASALLGRGGTIAPYLRIAWEKAGTDKMFAKRMQFAFPKTDNIPTLKKHRINPLQYEQDFMIGFKNTYQIFIKNKNYLLSRKSVLHAFNSTEIRVLLRNTADYGKLLYESYHPELWYFAEKRKQHFEWLNKQGGRNSIHYKIVPFELYDLNHGNIPYFTTTSQSKTIYNSNKKPTGIQVIETGLQRIKRNIATHINEQDLWLQSTIIRQSYEAARLNNGAKRSPRKMRSNVTPLPHIEICHQAIQIACAVLDRIEKTAIKEEHLITWPTLLPLSSSQHSTHDLWTTDLTNLSLYSGLPGIGLIFAYAGKILNKKKYIEIAQYCCHTIEYYTHLSTEHLPQSVGAFAGLGGLLYTLSHFYHLWHFPSTKAGIQKICTLLQTRIPQDKTLDIISGVSGCLVAIQSARHIVEDEIIENIVISCVNHLLQYYPDPSQSPITNEAVTRSLLGVSHGVSGMRWALSIFYEQHLSHQTVKNWIINASKYERNCYVDKKKNWPDFRTNHLSFITAWCHGAPGIGLSKLDMPVRWHDDAVSTEIKAAINTTIQQGFKGYYNLCHGHLGNFDFLWEAILKNYHTKEDKKIWAICTSILQTLAKGTYPCDTPMNIITPGLMMGECGIASLMLRLIAPEQMPMILRLEVPR